MRHAAISFALQVDALAKKGERFDLLFVTDMLNLAEFKGLVDHQISQLPTVIYFHENQLTYPVREERERDYHFAFSNFSSCLAADQVWFNSRFHQDDFLSSLENFLNRMPDYQSTELIPSIHQRSSVVYPGLEQVTPRDHNHATLPPHILWSARWEHDKNPELFFAALERIKKANLPFRLSVLGERFEAVPSIFESARSDFSDQIVHWGYQPDRNLYLNCLQEADIFVSTADHEFYGIAALEAISAGVYPLLPNRLSYPELLKLIAPESHARHLYNGDLASLVDRLAHLLDNSDQSRFSYSDKVKRSAWTEPLGWASQIEAIDHRLERLVSPTRA